MSERISIKRTPNSRLSTVDFNNIPFGQTFSDHMFVADYENGAWVNPRIEAFGNFSINPACFALHYGQAIFEGMKAAKKVDGTPVLFRPELHAQRLNASAKRMCMPAFPEDLFLEAIHTLIGLDHVWIPPQEGSALYIRPFMFACDEFFGVRPGNKYKMIIYTGPVGPYYATPVTLKAELEYVRAIAGGTGEAKAAGNYAGALLPTEKAKAEGYDQVMWMDGHEFRYVQEVGTMNIFFVMDGKLITPETDGAILKGITRKSIIELMREKGYEVIEQKVDIYDLLKGAEEGTLTEAFGAGTAAVVIPIAEIAYKEQKIKFANPENGAMAALIKDTINGMRSGRLPDPHGWVIPVKELELA